MRLYELCLRLNVKFCRNVMDLFDFYYLKLGSVVLCSMMYFIVVLFLIFVVVFFGKLF